MANLSTKANSRPSGMGNYSFGDGRGGSNPFTIMKNSKSGRDSYSKYNSYSAPVKKESSYLSPPSRNSSFGTSGRSNTFSNLYAARGNTKGTMSFGDGRGGGNSDFIFKS